jgi:hypothetical protein
VGKAVHVSPILGYIEPLGASRSAESALAFPRRERRSLKSDSLLETDASPAEKADQANDDQVECDDVVEQSRHDQDQDARDEGRQGSECDVHTANMPGLGRAKPAVADRATAVLVAQLAGVLVDSDTSSHAENSSIVISPVPVRST